MDEISTNNPKFDSKDIKIINKFIKTNFGDEVTPRLLLDAARPKTSPIHEFFEWSDSVAAERYRLDQARSLIISIYVESDTGKPMREYLRVKVNNKPVYMKNDTVRLDKDLMNQVIEGAHNHLLNWRNRYEIYCEYFELTYEIKGKRNVIKKENRNQGRNKDHDTRGEPKNRKPHNRGDLTTSR